MTVRRFPAQGAVRPDRIVVGHVFPEDPAEMSLVEDEDVVETLAPDRPDRAFDDGVGSGRAEWRDDWLDADVLEPEAR